MYCKNCGSQIDDKAVVCPHCGVAVRGGGQTESGNTLAIAGFVLSFFIAIAGLICSIMGYRKCKNEGAPYKGFAIAGIIISAVSMISVVIVIIVSIAAVGTAMTLV